MTGAPDPLTKIRIEFKPEYGDHVKLCHGVMAFFHWFGAILFYLQIGVIILIIVDAFHYIPGGIAQQKCPNYRNETLCSTAWKVITCFSIVYFIEAYILANVIHGVILLPSCGRWHMRRRFDFEAMREDIHQRKCQSYIRMGCTEVFFTPVLKSNIYSFAVIALLVTINISTISIVFTIIGGFILPFVATAHEIMSFVIQPKKAKTTADAETAIDAETTTDAETITDAETTNAAKTTSDAKKTTTLVGETVPTSDKRGGAFKEKNAEITPLTLISDADQ